MPDPYISRPTHTIGSDSGTRPGRLKDRQHLVRQRPLKRPCLVPRRAQPDVPFFPGRQDHRHRLRVDRLRRLAGLGRKEGEDITGLKPGL